MRLYCSSTGRSTASAAAATSAPEGRTAVGAEDAESPRRGQRGQAVGGADIGDAQPGAEKIGWTSFETYRADAPLVRSGLIGPVRILSGE